jgi:hypothetical protein
MGLANVATNSNNDEMQHVLGPAPPGAAWQNLPTRTASAEH